MSFHFKSHFFPGAAFAKLTVPPPVLYGESLNCAWDSRRFGTSGGWPRTMRSEREETPPPQKLAPLVEKAGFPEKDINTGLKMFDS